MNLTTILRTAQASIKSHTIFTSYANNAASSRKSKLTSFLLVFSLLFSLFRVESGWGQCVTNDYGEYGALNPICGASGFGSWSTVNYCYAREYSVVSVVSGSIYEFQTYRTSNNASRYATITTTANVPLVFGTTSNVAAVTWTSTFTGTVRFWTHSNSTCGGSTADHDRRVRCSPPPPCVAPTVQTSALTAGTPGVTSANINWSNGNGAGRVVYINSTNSFTNPTNGLNPTASTAWSNTGQQCIYNGTGTGPVTVTGLAASTTYYLRAFEYCAPDRNYQTATATGNSNSFTTAAPSPTLSVSGTLSFSSQCVNTTSNQSSFTVSGVYLTNNVSIGAVTGYTYSTNAAGPYTSTLTLTPSSGTLGSTTIFVRFTPTSATTFNGPIVVSSTGASSVNVSASGTGIAIPTVNAGPDVTICNGSTTVFSGSSNATAVSGTASATYNLGNGSTEYSSSPSTSINSNCPLNLSVSIPVGALITSVNVSYSMSAVNEPSLSDYGYMSEQASFLECTSIGGLKESQISYGSGNSTGVLNYSRTGLSIANSVAGGGNITFRLHAFKLYAWYTGCSTLFNYVNNNSFTVTVNYTLPVSNVWTPSTALSSTTSLTPTCSATTTTNYTLTSTAGNGCSSSDQVLVTVLPLPTQPTVSTAGAYCNSTTITAANGSSGTMYFQGTNASGTSTATPSTSQVISASGTYYFRAYNGTCWGNAGSAAIVINTQPVITDQPSSTGETKCNLSETFTALTVTATGSNLSYQWYSNTTASNIGGTLISGATSSSYVPSNATVGTTYYYCIISSASCPSTTSDVSGGITVISSPAAPSVSPSTLTVNVGASATFTAALNSSSNSLRWWNAATNGNQMDPDATTPGLDDAVFISDIAQVSPPNPNPTPSYNVAFCTPGTTYTYYVEEFDAITGCSSLRTPMVITTNPLFSNTPSNLLICQANGSVTLQANIIPDASQSFQWQSRIDTTQNFQNITINATSALYLASPSVTTHYRLATNLTPLGCSTPLNESTTIFRVGVLPVNSFTPTATPSDVCISGTSSLAANLSSSGFAVTELANPIYVPLSSANLLTSNGTAVVPTTSCLYCPLDDAGWANIPIGFTYNFFGPEYTTLNVGTNSNIQFGTYNGSGAGGLGDFTFANALPNNTEPMNMIAAASKDLNAGIANGTSQIRYKTEGISPTKVFTIEWFNVSGYGNNGVNSAQIKIFQTTGIVEVYISQSTGTDNKVVGLQNVDASIGSSAYSDLTDITSRAWRFIPGANYTYQWYLGSNTNSPIPGATNVTYGTTSDESATAGLVNYTIAATNPLTGCASTQPATITVNALPSNPISGGNVLACNNVSAAVLSATPPSTCTIDWYTSTGTYISSGSTLTVNPSTLSLGANTFYAKSFSANNCSSFGSGTAVLLTVVQAPVSPSTTAALSYCQGANAPILTATPISGNTLTWYQGASVLTGAPTPVTSTAATLNYSVTQTENGCPSNPANITVTINGTPTITNASLSQTMCSGNSTAVTFTSNIPGTTYAWSGTASTASLTGFTVSGTGHIPVMNNLINSSSSAQTVTYSVIPANSGCAGPASSYTITVNPTLSASVAISATTSSVCSGGAIAFTASPTNGGTNPTYQWFLNNVQVNGETTSTYNLATPNAGDEVYAKINVVNAPLCFNLSSNLASSASITLNDDPATPAVSIIQSTPTTTNCAGTNVTFSVASSAAMGTNPGFQWKLNGVNTVTTASYSTTSLVNGDVVSLEMTTSIIPSCVTAPTATSTGITMTVTPVTTITSQPIGVSVCQGASPILNAAASGTGSLTYQWQSCTSASATTGTNLSAVSYPTALTTALTTPAAGSTAGFYRMIATGTCGSASSDIATISINTPTAITTPPAAQARCEGTTATFTTVAQGQGSISYQWLFNGLAISGAINASYEIPNLQALNAGQYAVTVSATCGTVTSPAVQLTMNPLTTISIQPLSDSLCVGEPLSLSVQASGTAPISYQWYRGTTQITSASAIPGIYLDNVGTVAESGLYSVVVSGGCSSLTSSVANVVISPNTLITTQPQLYTGCALNPTALSVSAIGDNLRYQWSIGSTPPLSAITGATNATYSLSNPLTSNSGSYSVVVTGTCGVQTSNIALVTINPVPSAGTISGGNSGVCVGSTINLTNLASGGVWTSSNPAIGSISASGALTGVSAGTITVTYTVTNSFTTCFSTATKIIQVKAVPTALILPPLATSICQGEAMNLQSSSAISYLWSNGATTSIIAVNSSTIGISNYSVTVTNGFGCSATSAPLAITVIPAPTVAAITGSGNFPNFCLGNTSNLANATANGLWSSSNTNVLTVNPLSGSANALTVGTATVSYYVANVPGCLNPNPGTATASITVSTPPAAFITSSGSTTFCQGGSVTLTAPSGAGYNYFWSTGETTQSISASTSGSYTLTVTATGGCSVTSLPTTVTVLPIPTATIYPTGAINICAGSNVTLSTGSAVSYAWSNGANTPTISVNTAGNYSVTLTGTNGCTVTSAVSTVALTPVPIAVISANGPTNICDGGSVGLTVPTAGSYLWSNGATTQTITATSTGNYSVTATNGVCSVTSTPVYVNFNPVPSSTITTSGPTTFCQGGNVTLSAPIGNSYNYLWSNGATTQSITVSASGTYSVTVSNSFNCSSTSLPISVVVNALPTASITAAGSTTICSGNSLSLNAATASGYLWSTGATTQSISVSVAGNYTVEAISAEGCTAISSVVALNVLPSPTAVITQASGTTFCQGGSVVINATPASSYLWSTNETTQSISATTTGVYSVFVTAANGCTATSNSINVNVLPIPTAVIYPGTNVDICAGSTVTLSTGTAASYAWSNGANTPTITVGANGTHTVTLTGSNGCTATSSVTTVSVNPIPVATITAAGSTNICSGTSVNLTAATAGSYLWSTGETTQTIAASLAGTYTVTVTTAGCSATSSGTSINVNPAPTADVTADGPTSFCQGGSVGFTANSGNGYTYLWSSGETTSSISTATSGNYSVTVSNQTGCSTTSAVNAVVVNPIPVATITAGGSTTICSGSSVSLQASAGATYLWSNGASTPSINASLAGNYTVTVTSAAGCSATSAPTTIVVNALPSAAISTSGSTTFCQGASLSLNTTGGLSSYLWNTGETTASINATTSGNYSVTVTNSFGCSATSSPTVVNVLAAPTAVIYPGTNVDICAGSTVTLSTGTAASYAWSNGANTPTITVGANGTHTVTLTGSNGCTATSSVTTVSVNPIPVATITAAGSTNICSGTSVNLTAATAGSYLWSTGETTQTIAASLAGTYTVTVTTAGCSATSSGTSINVNPAPTADVTADGPTSFCQGGSVGFTANSGNGYTYLWSSGETTSSISTATSGNYSVTVSNQTGCSTTSAVNAVVVNPIPVATITAGGSTTICSGSSVSLQASAGATYLWSNGASTPSINASLAGNYTVTVTSAAGCSATSAPTTIVVNALPSAAISTSGSTTFCQGGNVGLSANSGMTSYLWSNGATGQSISAGNPGLYSVLVTDANGCSASSNLITVNVNLAPTATIFPGTNVTICSGSSVTLSTNSAISYNWSTGAITPTIQVNTSGTYSVTLTGSNGCSATSPATIVTVITSPTAAITSSGPTTICQGDNVSLSAPLGANSYLWNTGATTQTITVSLVGSYFVTVGSNGCSATSPSTFVSYNPVPSATVTASGPTTFCQGNNVSFSAPAGNGNTYLWNNGETTQVINTATAGNFSVTVTNAYGCSATSASNPVLVNPLPVVTPITGFASICEGTQGQVSNVMTGGVYASSNLGTASIGQLNGQIAGLTAGNSTISYIYTDVNGCSSTVYYPVTIIAAPVATISAGGPTTFCQGGSVVLTASTGTSYAWSTGATTASITVSNSGSYSVTVTGANGCSASSQATSVNVLTPSSVSVINGANAVCVNSATSLTNASSGGTWSSSNPLIASVSTAGDVTGVSAGSATITYAINSTNGCQNAATKVVTVNAVPATALTASGATTFCQGSNVSLTASAGSTYLWNNGSTTASITASTSGTYSVTVTNTNGCSSVSTNQLVTVNANPTAVISTNGSTNLCTGGSITLMASPNSSYLWSTGATSSSITVTTAGSYTVTVTDANGCSAISTATNVVVNASPSAIVTASGPTTICSGNNVVLSAPSVVGNTYQWSNNGVLISGATNPNYTATTSGTYSVTITNASGCSVTSITMPVSVIQATAATITPSGSTSLCSGSSVVLTANSGASYLWSNGATTPSITVNTADNYTVTVTNSSGCSATSSITPVVINAAPAATITAGGPTTFCQGANVVLTASTGATYLWSNGATTSSITASTPGTYSVLITNASGCASTSAGTAITVNAAPNASITASGSTTFCTGGSVTLTASAGASYLWSSGETTASISVNAAGVRTVSVTNASGCSTTSAATTIVVNATPTATIVAAGPTSICSGSTVGLTASTGSSYLWSNGATTAGIIANTSGNYSVTVYNANGCSATSTPILVTVNNPSVANISTSGTTTFCQGGSVVLTATPASSYSWSTGATTQSINASTSGNYFVTLTNSAGCTSTSPVTVVTVNSLPTVTVTASGPLSFCQGGSVTLTASPATNYSWSNGATTSSITVSTAGNYTVQVANNSGCSITSASTAIVVNALPTATITAGGSLSLCAGSSVNLTSSTGSTYLWSNGATTQTIAASVAGNYTVQVTNASGCTSTSSVSSVQVNTLPTPSVTAIGSTTICQGSTVTLTTSTGTGLTYQWKNNGTNILGAISASFIANSAGSYTVQVTNAAGCSGTSTASNVVVNALPVASISNSGSNTICTGSSVSLTASGGTAYAWSNGATTAAIAVNATGNYSVQVTNASGCTSSTSSAITVVTPTAAIISANGPTTFCTGQNVTLTANPGATYVWSTGETTASITVSASNNISVQVGYTNGCSSTSAIMPITVNALPTASISANGATSFCPGSSVTLTASPGSSYLWTNGATSNSIVVSALGSYGVSVTNAAGCTAVATPTVITVFAVPTASITASGPTSFCQGGALNLSASTGASYLWSSGETSSSISTGVSGIYSVTVIDANGCSAVSSTVPVTVNAVPVASIQANGPTTVCQGSSVVLTANGGTGFTWSNAATTSSIIVNTTGTYGVTVTNAAGCSSVVTPVSITVNPIQVLDPISGANSVCIGLTTTYANTISGGLWTSDNNAVATVSSTGGLVTGVSSGSATIKYQFINASGCTSEVTKVVTVNGIQPVSISTSGSTSFCQGASVTLTAPAGLSYNWTNGLTTQSITVNTSGTYGVIASNTAGCSTSSSTVLVSVNPLPVASISSTSTTLCQGTNLQLNAPANAATYAWSTGATTQNILITTPGIYSVTLTDANGCAATANTTITNGIVPQAAISATGATTFCQGGSVVLNAAGGNSFLWNNGATTQNITVSAPGNYSVLVTNAAGCSSMSNSTMVNVLQAPNATITAYGPTTFCQGGSVTLATSGATSYAWSNSLTTQSIVPTTSGTYNVVVTGANGCTATSNGISVTVNPIPTAVITPSGATTFCEGTSVNLVASGGASYAWNSGSTAATLAASTGGVYIVTVTNAGGCTDTETITVTVNEVPSAFIVTSGATTFCQGGEVSLTAQGGNTYVWSNNATTQSISVSTAGTYSATILSPNGCSVTSNAISVDVNQPSSSSITATAFDGYILNEILYTQSGTYTQTLTNAAGCDSTITLNLTLTVGIEEGTLTDVSLYPNPTSESFTIQTTIPLFGTYNVVDAQGKLVFEGMMTGTETQVNISSVARGIYYLRILELSEPLRVVKN